MGNLIYLVTVYTYMVHTIRSEHTILFESYFEKVRK